MESDLNVPMALGAVFILIRTANQHFANGEMSKNDASLILDALEKINSVVAVFDFNPACADIEDPEIEAWSTCGKTHANARITKRRIGSAKICKGEMW